MTRSEDLTATARIRRAAVDRFARHGFASTTLRQIAADAGVTHGLVRHHFGDKEGLRRAADEDVLERLRPVFDTPTDAPPDVVLEHRRRELLALVDHDPTPLDYLARSLVEGTSPGTVLFSRLAEGFRHHLAAMDQAGILRPAGDPDIRAGLVMVVTLGAWILRPLLQDTFEISLFDHDGLARWLAGEQDLFRHGVLRPPPKGTAP
jgi:TetR/AcrR family transcriptional regulator, regulator of cefoperazone and chloramphenicol sensitivity